MLYKKHTNGLDHRVTTCVSLNLLTTTLTTNQSSNIREIQIPVAEQILFRKRHDAATDCRWYSRLLGLDARSLTYRFYSFQLIMESIIRDGLCIWACLAWNLVMECDRPVIPERRHRHLAPRQLTRVCNHILNGYHRLILSTHREPNMQSEFLHLH